MTSSAERENIIGIVFPLFEEHIQRFFDFEKTVFVKFISRKLTRLSSGSRLFFYQSRSKKEIVGEARIVETDSRTADEVLDTYGDRLFLTPKELREYVKDRNSKSMLVLVLTGFRKYSVPLRLGRPVTMAGQYMTKRTFEKAQSSI